MNAMSKNTPTASLNLSTRAMLVSLKIGYWSPTKVDKEVTTDVLERNRAEPKTGKFTKFLINRAAMKALGKAMSRGREVHKNMTLPWEDSGPRILKASAYDEYAKEMRLLRGQFLTARDDFVEDFPKLVKEAEKALGRLYNPNEYPSPEEIRAKFSWENQISPLPEAKDFRVKLGDKEMSSIMRDLEKRTSDRYKGAMKEIYSRIADVTGHMAEKLAAYKPSPGPYMGDAEGIFRDTLVSNIRELAEMIPVLNITDDPALEQLRIQLLEDCCKYEPEELRSSKNPEPRRKAQKAAEKIFAKVSRFAA